MASASFTVLNQRKRKYLEGRTNGLTKTEAKRLAGYAESTDPCKIENTSVKAAFSRLVRQYIPAHKLAARIAEGVDATKTIIVGSGEKAEGQEVADFRERREYVKLAAEYGQYVELESKSADVSVAVGFTLINGITRPKQEPGA